MCKHKTHKRKIGMIGMIRKDGMTGVLRKQDMKNALDLKVARGSRTFPRKQNGNGFVKEARSLRTKKRVFY